MRSIAFLIITITITSVQACLPHDPAVQLAVGYMLQQRYTDARVYLDSILKKNPENMQALYCRLYVFQTELVDYESYTLHGDAYLKSVDSVIAIIEKKRKKASAQQQLQHQFLIASLYSTQSLVLAKQERWLKAVTLARSALKVLEKVKKSDTACYDASYFIGAFNYYLGQNLFWLRFFSKKSEYGLEEMKKAACYSPIFNTAAATSLAWIYIQRNELNRADTTISSLLLKNPDNTMFIRIKTRLLVVQKCFPQAIGYGRKLIVISSNRPTVNWSDLLSGYQTVIESYSSLNDTANCRKAITEALSLKIPPEAHGLIYVQKHLKYIYEKRDQLNKS
ncbi:MAG: hypothetical protein JW795_14775 [Chitinivibrionales bacterium]|nr:hypothetical protein [Chitinivibrionales bacterium]